MSYEGPEIDALFQLVTQVGQPTFDKSKLSRPPVKIVLEIIKMAHEYSNGVFPPLTEVITEFTAEEKQERLDYIANVASMVQQRDSSLVCEAKDITGGKEVQNTLNLLIAMMRYAIEAQVTNEAKGAQDAPIEEKQNEDRVAQPASDIAESETGNQEEILAAEPDADDVNENVTSLLAAKLSSLLSIEISEKQMARPPVKLLEEIFNGFNSATGGRFPPDSLTVRTEFSKDQKEERQEYIEDIIEYVKQHSGENLSVETKGITSGKCVGHTLYFLFVMCKLCERVLSGESLGRKQPSVHQEDQPDAEEEQGAFFNLMENPSTEIFAPNVAVDKPQLVVNKPANDKHIELDAPEAIDNSEKQKNAQEILDNDEKIDQINDEQAEREYLAAKRSEEEIEEMERRRLTNAFQDVKTNEKSAFNRPPPSQQRKREEMAVRAENVVVEKRIIEDSESEEDVPEQTADAGLVDIFGAATQAQAGGAFSQDILNTQKEYQELLNGGEGDKEEGSKIANQSNQKLLTSIQDSIRRIIPFSKATSFLEEHLVRMREDLTLADDECLVEDEKREKQTSLDLKSRSVVDAKVRSVSDELEQVRANFNELVQEGLML